MYWFYYPHRSRELVSPVCGIFVMCSLVEENIDHFMTCRAYGKEALEINWKLIYQNNVKNLNIIAKEVKRRQFLRNKNFMRLACLYFWLHCCRLMLSKNKELFENAPPYMIIRSYLQEGLYISSGQIYKLIVKLTCIHVQLLK